MTFPKYERTPVPASFSLFPRPMLAAWVTIAFDRNTSRTICTVFMPLLMFRKPSFTARLPTFRAARPPATFRTVCTSFGFAWANSEILVTRTATLSATSPTMGRRFCPSTIPRLVMEFLAFAILASVVSAIVAKALSVMPALLTISATEALKPSTPFESSDMAAFPASALPNISAMVFPLFAASACRIPSTSPRDFPLAIRSAKPLPAADRRALSATVPLLPSSFSILLA